MRFCAILLAVFASLMATTLGACGGGGGTTGSVTSITPRLSAFTATVFLIEGTGFGTPNSTAQVRFTATTGTPFNTGTSAVAIVDVTIASGTRAVGVAPVPQNTDFLASVELLLPNVGVLQSTAPGIFEHQGFNIVGINDDTLVGGPANEWFWGGVGNDSISAGDGDDRLLGEEDEDWLNGQNGNDISTGGPGRDSFLLEPLPGTWDDTISDFILSHERIFLLGVPANITGLSNLTAVSDTGQGGDVVLHWAGGGTVTLQGLGTGSYNSLAALLASGLVVRIMP